MATALKDISFTKPVISGETNYKGGTTYNLGSSDTIVAGITSGSITLIEYGSGCGWWFNGHATSAGSAFAIIEYGGCGSLSYTAIAPKLDCINVGSGVFNYFYGGLTNGGSILNFYDIYDKLGVITYGGSDGTIFDGGLSCGGNTTLRFDGSSSYYTPVIRIGGSDYSLSVDSNGFVKATPN